MATQNEYNDYLKHIIKFNSDKDIIALREKYKEPTFFEIISKQRSETTYSSFLKWMFQSSSTDLDTVSPILLLLDVLVSQDNKGLIDETFKKHIITRSFKINDIEVEAEKPVNTLVSDLNIDEKNNCAKLNKDDIRNIITKCQDRIDLFVNCAIELDGDNKQVQIIIENKIDSREGENKKNAKTTVGKYDKASQTERYYIATALECEYANSQNIIQLYVYLAPTYSEDCRCDKYIRINYQDIIDGIVAPMLASSTLSTRERFFLEELKTELTFPSLESCNVRNSIAISNDNEKRFDTLWGKYEKLIVAAAITTSETEIYCINGEYFDYKPREELIKRCLSIKIDESKENKIIIEKPQEKKLKEIHYDGKIYYDANKQYNTILKFAKEKNVLRDNDYDEFSGDLRNKIDGADSMLLSSFWENNKRFLLAIMNGLPEQKRKNVVCLTKEVSKRKITRNWVYYNGTLLNEEYLDNKPANNAETAWLIIKAWAEKVKDGKISLKELNDTFTLENCNTYYRSGKWLKNLFHKYNEDGVYIADGDQQVPNTLVKAGEWDFYKPVDSNDKKFRISTIEGDNDAIMLKMWRKDGLQRLIDLVTGPNNEYFEKGTLTIQPDK